MNRHKLQVSKRNDTLQKCTYISSLNSPQALETTTCIIYYERPFSFSVFMLRVETELGLWPGRRDDVRALLRSFTQDKGQAGLDAAWSEYTSQWGPSPSQDQMKITAVEVGTDNYFLVAVQTAIYLHAAAAK